MESYTQKARGPCWLRLYFLSEGGALLETHAPTQTHSSAHSPLCSDSLQGSPKKLPTMHLASAQKAQFLHRLPMLMARGIGLWSGWAL